MEENGKIIIKLIKAMHNTPFAEQISTISTIITTRFAVRANVDSGGIGMPIAEALREKHRAVIQGVTFTNSLKQRMMVNLRMLFEKQMIVLPNHAQLINSLHKIQRKRTATGLEQFEAAEDETGEHGDFAWALALACYSQKSSGFPIYGVKV